MRKTERGYFKKTILVYLFQSFTHVTHVKEKKYLIILIILATRGWFGSCRVKPFKKKFHFLYLKNAIVRGNRSRSLVRMRQGFSVTSSTNNETLDEEVASSS